VMPFQYFYLEYATQSSRRLIRINSASRRLRFIAHERPGPMRIHQLSAEEAVTSLQNAPNDPV
jgi:hypothetical protein